MIISREVSRNLVDLDFGHTLGFFSRFCRFTDRQAASCLGETCCTMQSSTVRYSTERYSAVRYSTVQLHRRNDMTRLNPSFHLQNFGAGLLCRCVGTDTDTDTDTGTGTVCRRTCLSLLLLVSLSVVVLLP